MAFGMEVSEDDVDKTEDFKKKVEMIFEGRARNMRYVNLLMILPNLFN